jgi:hypothetical protein
MSPRVDDRESRTGSASGPADGGRDRDATLQLMIALGRAYRALERGVRPQLAERGLGLSEFAVLEVLYHKGPLTLGEIRDRIHVTGPVPPMSSRSSKNVAWCGGWPAQTTSGPSSAS